MNASIRSTDASSRRSLLLGEMSQAHEALLALFGGIEEADLHGALAALDQLAGVGDRLDCSDLAAWCRAKGRHSAEMGLDSFGAALPQLLDLWEQAQGAVIARAFSPQPIDYPPTRLQLDPQLCAGGGTPVAQPPQRSPSAVTAPHSRVPHDELDCEPVPPAPA